MTTNLWRPFFSETVLRPERHRLVRQVVRFRAAYYGSGAKTRKHADETGSRPFAPVIRPSSSLSSPTGPGKKDINFTIEHTHRRSSREKRHRGANEPRYISGQAAAPRRYIENTARVRTHFMYLRPRCNGAGSWAPRGTVFAMRNLGRKCYFPHLVLLNIPCTLPRDNCTAFVGPNQRLRMVMAPRAWLQQRGAGLRRAACKRPRKVYRSVLRKRTASHARDKRHAGIDLGSFV